MLGYASRKYLWTKAKKVMNARLVRIIKEKQRREKEIISMRKLADISLATLPDVRRK